METILITGAAGFIGHKTSELLLASGYKVVGLDNISDYYDTSLKKLRLRQLKMHSAFVFFRGSIENEKLLKKIFSRFSITKVINLAAQAGVRYSIENPQVYCNTNILGVVNILQQMKKFGIKKLVTASSSSVYAGESTPFLEDLAVNKPISPYAASKSSEMFCYAYNHLFDIDISMLRYFTVYGPYGRPDMAIFRFIKWIDEGTPITVYGDGEQARDFTYIDDIAAGTIRALQNVGIEVFNLGGGNRPVSINSVIEQIESLLGKKAKRITKEFNKADVKTTWANIDKAERILQWKPVISVEEGIKRTVEWYRQNRSQIKKINV